VSGERGDCPGGVGDVVRPKKETLMSKGNLEGKSNRWPIHSAHFWCGLLAGLGVGLLTAAALVELELLTLHRKAWVSLVGAVLVGVAGLVGWRGQSDNGPAR
jgi:hypothetical protein